MINTFTEVEFKLEANFSIATMFIVGQDAIMRYVKCPGEWGGESKKCSTQLSLKRTEKTYQRGDSWA